MSSYPNDAKPKDSAKETKTQKELSKLPSRWRIIKGNINEVVLPSSTEEVYINVEVSEKDIKGLNEKRALKMVLLKRITNNDADNNKDVLSMFLIHEMPLEAQKKLLTEKEMGVRGAEACCVDLALVRRVKESCHKALIPDIAQGHVLLTPNRPENTGGQWSVFYVGQLPKRYSEKFFSELTLLNIFSQEESSWLQNICGYKTSPQAQALEDKLAECLATKELDIKVALECARQIHQLSVETNKKNNTYLPLPMDGGSAPQFDSENFCRTGASYTPCLDDACAAWDLGNRLKTMGKVNEAIEAFAILTEDSPFYDDALEEVAQILQTRFGGDKARMIDELKKIFPKDTSIGEEESDEEEASDESDMRSNAVAGSGLSLTSSDASAGNVATGSTLTFSAASNNLSSAPIVPNTNATAGNTATVSDRADRKASNR